MQTTDDLRVGGTLTLTVSAFDRTTKLPITGGTCVVDFFAPPKDPDNNPADRTVVDHTVSAVFDSGQSAYTANIATVGWVPGRWSYRSTMTDSSSNVGYDYGTFLLRA